MGNTESSQKFLNTIIAWHCSQIWRTIPVHALQASPVLLEKRKKKNFQEQQFGQVYVITNNVKKSQTDTFKFVTF